LKIRICIDIRICQKSSRFTGVGIYAFNLCKFILQKNSEFDFWFLVLKGKSLPLDLPLDRLIFVKRFSKPESLQELFDFFDLKYLLKKNKISLYHSLVPGILSPSKSLYVVSTIHDVIPDILPLESHKYFYERFMYNFKMKMVLKSSYIITNSIATKNDFTKTYNFNHLNISVIYISSQFSKDHFLSTPKINGSIWHRKYILYTGGFNYRKNVPMVIRSFAKIAKQFSDVDLLLVGKTSSEQLKGLENLIACYHELKGRIIFKGFISDNDLPNYYANSEMLVYPSLYEGFGIPVLEAMQCGTPIITSNRGSIPEVIGKIGIIVNPNSEYEIAESMIKILRDTKFQNSLIEKGLFQAQKFTWVKCIEETFDIYRKVLNRI
jgi:glycosyltransferase involved in cell wall biosynthesis